MLGAMTRTISIARESFPDRPAFDTALSRAILIGVARGDLGETLRVARPGAMVAFGRRDVTSPGYRQAVEVARQHGFQAVERLAGGRAAVFHEGTVALAWAVPDPAPLRRTHERFEEAAAVVASALRRLGIDARVGEVPGEYCPGDYSVNARGRTKIAGIGQRVVKGAAHLGGVIVATGGGRVRDILEPVYAALTLAWDPATAGSAEDEVASTGVEAVERALIDELASRYELRPEPLGPETLELAAELEAMHLSPALGRRASGET
jgi:octanoyl-[GcvH]:protein N-octanoyltransferase